MVDECRAVLDGETLIVENSRVRRIHETSGECSFSLPDPLSFALYTYRAD